MNTTWQAITSEFVPSSELTRALALNVLPVNIGRVIGPPLGGLLAAGPRSAMSVSSTQREPGCVMHAVLRLSSRSWFERAVTFCDPS
jgi:MFS family permease